MDKAEKEGSSKNINQERYERREKTKAHTEVVWEAGEAKESWSHQETQVSKRTKITEKMHWTG